jgi:septal ring factor EnvC (AmiA/AmiB activator)
MRVSVVFGVLALLLTFSVSAYALDSKCVVVGQAASDLSLIAREAADAQKQADEIEAYLRNSSADWRGVADQMAYLGEHVRNLQKLIAGFERREPKLTEAQSQQLERLKAGLATLTVFVNNTYRLIAEQQLMPHRDALMMNAQMMSIRAGIIRDAARSLRVVTSA